PSLQATRYLRPSMVTETWDIARAFSKRRIGLNLQNSAPTGRERARRLERRGRAAWRLRRWRIRARATGRRRRRVRPQAASDRLASVRIPLACSRALRRGAYAGLSPIRALRPRRRDV